MRAPTLEGTIERRLLINYRVDPEVVAGLLPKPLRPQRTAGWAVAGICLLRLSELRPVHFPRFVGQRSENVAHRIAVEWDGPDGIRTGVYINRRDSDSLLNVAVGGRIFPGEHQRATFTVVESADEIEIGVHSQDGQSNIEVHARIVGALKGSELFEDLDAASQFFQQGSIGFSPRSDAASLDVMRLTTDAWAMDALSIESVSSSYFESLTRFPCGTATFDCGLAMREIPVRWLDVTNEVMAELASSGLGMAR
jgi:uncharacterized protein YqjF (DUF2071 family)